MKVNCTYCGIEFDKPVNKVNQAIRDNKNLYCSQECYHKSKVKKIKCSCGFCGKELEKTPSEIKKSKTGNVYCNKSCACSANNTLFRSGENNPNWKDGACKTKHYANKAFRYYVNECAICGFDKLPALEVHHIDKNRENDDITNLIILCGNCHNLHHYGELELPVDIAETAKKF